MAGILFSIQVWSDQNQSFEGLGNNVTYTFINPGEATINITVTDSNNVNFSRSFITKMSALINAYFVYIKVWCM